MNTRTRHRFYFLLAICCSACGTVLCFIKYQPITTWDSSRLHWIEREWKAIIEKANNTPRQEAIEKYGFKNEILDKMLEDLLEKRLSMNDRRRLASTCGSEQFDADEHKEFNWTVLAFIVRSFIDSGDRENLIGVLSTHFPDRVCGYTTTESYLANNSDKLHNAIFVLEDAYTKSQDPKIRRHIAIAVRRAFAPSGIRGTDDFEFITNAMHWYRKKKDEITPNESYWKNTFFSESYNELNPYYQNAPYEKGEPLFVEKPSTPEEKAEESQ